MSSPGTKGKKFSGILPVLLFIVLGILIFRQYLFYYPLKLDLFYLPGFFDSSSIENIVYLFESVLIWVVYLVSVIILGVLFQRLLGITCKNDTAIIEWFALGNVILALMILGLSILGFLYPMILFFLYLFLLLAGVSLLREGKREFAKINIFPDMDLGWFKIVFILLLGISFCIALTPTTESDALRYHVSIPERIIQEKGFFYNAYNSFFQFPAMIEMQYTFVSAFFSGTMGPKLVHWTYFLMTVFLLNQVTVQFFPRVLSRWVIIIFSSTPFIPIISGWAFIETALTFYILFIFYFLFRIQEEKTILSGTIVISLMMGLLLGAKYSMIAIIPIFGILVPGYIWSISRRKAVIAMGIMMMVTMVIASPWYIKNYIYTGNPVYPMAYTLFGGENWSEENARFYMQHAQYKGGLTDSKQQGIFYRAIETLYLPIKATMNPPGFALTESRKISWVYRMTGNRLFLPDNFGDWQLGPIYLFSLPFLLGGFYSKIRKKEFGWGTRETLLLIFTILYYLVWTQSYRDNRFLLPILPFICIGIGILIKEFQNKIVQFLLLIMIIYNTLWIYQTVVREHNPFPYLLGQTTPESYLSRKLDYYPSYRELQKIDMGKNPVLLIGEYRPLYLELPNYTNDYFDTPVIGRLLWNVKSMEEINERIGELKVKYILYNENELSKYLPDFARHFRTREEIELYRQFISRLLEKPVYILENPRDISEMEVSRIRKFMNDPTRDPRKIFISKL